MGWRKKKRRIKGREREKNPGGPRRERERERKENERSEGVERRGGREGKCGRGKLFSGHAR